jgi:mycoredoxin
MEHPPSVKVYSTKWCTDCMLAKQFLKQQGIPYDDILLETDPEAKNYLIERLGRTAKVPVLEIDGRVVSCNPFDRAKLAAELGISL